MGCDDETFPLFLTNKLITSTDSALSMFASSQSDFVPVAKSGISAAVSTTSTGIELLQGSVAMPEVWPMVFMLSTKTGGKSVCFDLLVDTESFDG